MRTSLLFLFATFLTASAGEIPELRYVALGDSITWGEDSTNPCVPDSPLMIPANCGQGTSYVDLFARWLATQGTVSMQDLGIRGTRIDDLVEMSFPKIHADTNLFTLYEGTNDLHDVADLYRDPAKLNDALLTFEAKYAALLSTLEKRYPKSQIILLNVPNLGMLKYFQQWGADFVRALSDSTIRFNREFLDTFQKKGYTVVDLACDPESYNPANLFSDGLHPNDAGYRKIADKIAKYYSAAPPVYPGGCAQMPAR